MAESENSSNALLKEDEIDLITLAKRIWEGRKTIIRTVIIFTLMGIFIAIFSKKEYTATTTMVPQINNPSSKLGGLSSLASLAGFNLDLSAGGGDISPVLYPQIVKSVSFQLELMNTKYEFEEDERPITLFNYYMDYYKPSLFELIRKYTVGLPGILIEAVKGQKDKKSIGQDKKIIRLTEDQDYVRKIIEKQLSLSVNDQEGYLTLTSKFHQAYLSAQIAQKAQELLQDCITRFKVEKASAQLEFISGRYNEKKKEFEKAQSRLAEYRDANQNISSSLAQTQEEKLENEYQLAFDVYSELAKQLEQAQIKVKEDTPVFSVIKEVTIPIEKSKPIKSLILIIWFFMGIIFGMLWVIGKKIYNTLKNKWLSS